MLTLISVFSSLVVVVLLPGGFTTVVLVSFFSEGGFTIVVLLSFFSAGGLTVVVFCSHAANKPNIANREIDFFIPPESYLAAIRSSLLPAALRPSQRVRLRFRGVCADRHKRGYPHDVSD